MVGQTDAPHPRAEEVAHTTCMYNKYAYVLPLKCSSIYFKHHLTRVYCPQVWAELQVFESRS